MVVGATVVMLAVSFPGLAQQPVAVENRYERILAVVPMVGRGTNEDPRRPMFAPTPAEMAAERRAVAARRGVNT